jgi:hypothetical protein
MVQCLVMMNACLKSNGKANPLCTSAMKVLFKYSKDPSNDFVFFKEKVPPLMYRALENVLASANLEGEESPFDLLIYIVGLIKNCSISLKLLDLFDVGLMVAILAKMLPMAF